MGNHPSSSSKPGSASGGSATPSDSPHPHHSSPRHQHHQQQQQIPLHPSQQQRRESRPFNIIPPHTASRSVVPPEASLAQAQGSTTSVVAGRPRSSLPGTAVSSLSGSPHSVPGNNGAQQQQQQQGQQQGHQGHASKPSTDSTGRLAVAPVKDEPSKPVDVPIEAGSLRSHQVHTPQKHAHYNSDMAAATQAAMDSSSILISNNSVTDMYLTHPPRLPLPIEEEVHTPGSPIVAPDEGQGLPDVGELGGSSEALTRKSSGLSAGTVEDEESEELRVDKTRDTVPTKLEWKRGGDKIYVTGSIFQWSRKQRLHPVEGKPGYFSVVVNVLPGTHHVRFLVDGIMQTSLDLPTTVDFGNNLVNFIEVNPDDVRGTHSRKQSQVVQKVASDVSADPENRGSRSTSVTKDAQVPKPPKERATLPPEAYAGEVPQYLLDFDQPEDSPAYQNSVAAIEKLPTPPGLPGFLGKPILNAAVLMKDDNSVLNMPSHAVLNHLATSSIKNNVLAVSATTRYRNKYVTTVIYKPTSSEEG